MTSESELLDILLAGMHVETDSNLTDLIFTWPPVDSVRYFHVDIIDGDQVMFNTGRRNC